MELFGANLTLPDFPRVKSLRGIGTSDSSQYADRLAGLATVRIYSEDYSLFGIVHSESCSLPIAARKGPFALGMEPAREVVEQYRDLKRKFDGEIERLCGKLWFRLGHKLGLL